MHYIFGRHAVRTFLTALLLFAGIFHARAAVTVTGDNGIIYNIKAGTMEVTVSASNKNLFNSQAVDLTIPAQVVDVSTTAVTSDPYTVVGIENDAFNGTTITGIRIEAPVPYIPVRCFNACKSLKSVDLAGVVPQINAYAFQDCSALEAVTGLESVTRIDQQGFYGCSSLDGIVLPEGLTEMGSGVFRLCTSLTSIEIPSTLVKIPYEAFYQCSSLEHVTLQEGLQIIGSSAFRNCTLLEFPTLPSTLQKISNTAFQSCLNLGTVTLTPGLSILNGAFNDSGLTELVWPEEPLTLETGVFNKCTKLTNLSIPGWMETVPASSFRFAQDIKTITVCEGVKNLNGYAFQTIPTLETLILPESLDVIGSYCFEKCALLGDVQFPTHMQRIYDFSFSGCDAMENLVLPAGAALDRNAFNGTTLKTIVFPDEPMGEIAESPFGSGQKDVKKLVIPGWMQRTPRSMCYNFEGLEEVIIEEGVEIITENTFYYCYSIPHISFPGSVKIIGNSAFYGCRSLETVTFAEGLQSIGNSSFQYCNLLSGLDFPSTFTSLGTHAFEGDVELTSVIFAADCPLKEIGENAFYACQKLKSVTLSNALEKIGTKAFRGCLELEGVVFPESLKEICAEGFHGNSLFGPLTLRAGMVIGDHAFHNAGVSEINFPEEPCTFGKNVFRSNSLMSSIEFPEWMTEIPYGFCSYWDKLTSVDFPDFVETIGEEAFMHCINLHDVDFKPSIKTIGRRAFAECWSQQPKFGEVVLNEGCMVGEEAFLSATVTSLRFVGCADFGKDVFKAVTTIESIAFPECMADIPDGFCSGWRNLTSVTLPATLRSIGKQTFYGCSKLESLDLSGYPDLEAIGEGAYYGAGIKSVIWPEHEVSVGKEAFRESKLESLEIPLWMTSIPELCFQQCYYITSLTFPDYPSDATLNIGNYAFYKTQRLQAIHFPDCNLDVGNEAFNYASAATEITWPQHSSITLGLGSFGHLSAMPSLVLPAGVEIVPKDCFLGCSNLQSLTLGPDIKELGFQSFRDCDLREITFNDILDNVGAYAFQANRNLQSVEIPGCVKTLSEDCFINCVSLEEVVLHEGLEKIGGYAFLGTCLKKLSLPSSCLEVGAGAFMNVSTLKELTIPEGVNLIRNQAFQGTGIETLTLPSSLTTLQDQVFMKCASLREVHSYAGCALQTGVFQDCTALEVYHAYVPITGMWQACFSGCTALEKFDYQPEEPLCSLGMYTFRNCTSLKEFPYLYNGSLDKEVFRNCTSLKQLTLPATGQWTRYLNGSQQGLTQGCTSLQSLVWPSTDRYFQFFPEDIADCPLEALSYSYVQDIWYPYSASTKRSIREYTPKAGITTTTPAKSRLMVMRGEKWKYEEAGYGQVFDIQEMKAPKFDIEGGIFSQFSPEENVNHYKCSLRWEVPLSDLNADGHTIVTLYRDDEEIGRVYFSQPSEPTYNADFAREVIAVQTMVKKPGDDEFKPTSFTGDFYFPVEQDNGELIYEMQYNVTGDVLYFDARTHKRLVSFDKYGYTSWFTFVDEFDSPALDSGLVPASYRYSARMDAYDYSIPVNNEGLELGEDGLRFHWEPHSTSEMEDGYVVMHTALAMPRLSGRGIYTYEDIAGDRDRALAVSDPGNFTLSYSIEPTLLTQKGKIDTRTVNMLDQVQAWALVEGGAAQKAGEKTLTGSVNQAQGVLNLSADYAMQAGARYQTVVHSLFRGEFGSPVLVVPGAPTLDAELAIRGSDHMWDTKGTHDLNWRAETTLTPHVEALGYSEEHPLRAEDWHLGMWRHFANTDMMFAKSQAGLDLDLLHHVDGFADDDTPPATTCSACHDERSLTHDEAEGTATYTDIIEPGWDRSYTVTYAPRMYVKVPSTMLPDQEAYVMAQTEVNHDGSPRTSLEALKAIGDGPARYFDMQGLPLSAPTPGTPCILLTPNGARKIITR